MQVNIEGRDLVIRIPLLAEPTKSKSGKTMLVATSGGPIETEALIDGKPITVGLNAYISK